MTTMSKEQTILFLADATDLAVDAWCSDSSKLNRSVDTIDGKFHDDSHLFRRISFSKDRSLTTSSASLFHRPYATSGGHEVNGLSFLSTIWV